MAKRIDENQPFVVEYLRRRGISVEPIHTLGKGRPDIMVGFKGRNLLFELKNPDQPPSKRQLTKDEKEFADHWKGQIDTVETVSEIIEILKRECP